MFDALFESRSTIAGRPLVSGGTLAITTHTLLIGLALWATASHGATRPHRPRVIELPPPATQPPAPRGLAALVVPRPHVTLGDLSGVLPPFPPTSLPLLDFHPATTPAPVSGGPGGDSRLSPGSPFPMDMVDERPEVLAGPPLTYPDLLRQAGIQGRVLVRAVVDTLGRVEPGSVAVVVSSNPGFDRAALDYLRRALFRPARVLGRPVRVLVEVPIEFRIERGR